MLVPLVLAPSFVATSFVAPLAEGKTVVRVGTTEIALRRQPRKGIEETRYRLTIGGRGTALTVETSSNLVDLSLSAARTPGGIVYGEIVHIESGAASVGDTYAFILNRGRLVWRHGLGITARGERFLLASAQDSYVTDSADAFVYARGRIRRVGPATAAHLESSGRVTGWYLADAKDRPASAVVSESSAPLYRRYFVWENGRRSLKGRRRTESE